MAASKHSSLVAKLDRDFLECGICLDPITKPKGLPCLHSFCQECLEKYSADQRDIVCPTCKQFSTIPSEGVTGFPAHFIINSLRETLDMEKLQIDSTAEQPECNRCKQPENKVTIHCLQCKEYFCQTCHMHHDSFTAMKQHKIVSLDGICTGKTTLPLATKDDQKCEDHEDEIKTFYCKTCQKLVCRNCIVMKQHCRDHQYVTMKDAAKKQASRLVQLAEQGKELMDALKEAIQKTDEVKKNLESSYQKGTRKIHTAEDVYKKKLTSMFDKHKTNLQKLKSDREAELDHTAENLKTSLLKLEKACDLATNISDKGTDFDITSTYTSLASNLEELTTVTRFDAVDESLGCFGVQTVGELEIPDVICLAGGERWMESGQIKTTEQPCRISVHPNGDVAITNCYTRTSFAKTANIYSKSGDMKYSLGPFDANLFDIAITSDNRYILPGKAALLFYDEQGRRLKYLKAATSNTNNQPKGPRTLTTDSRGRIIVGLWDNTISIHHADGQLISKFAAPTRPRRLAVTSMGEIAAIFLDNTLRLMDYSGSNVRVVQPPPGVSRWTPGDVCCSKQGEIFVLNDGEPKAVFRYIADGDECLGCVITGLDNPWGIAITEDGQQLYATENYQRLVKIFHRK